MYQKHERKDEKLRVLNAIISLQNDERFKLFQERLDGVIDSKLNMLVHRNFQQDRDYFELRGEVRGLVYIRDFLFHAKDHVNKLKAQGG